MSLLLTNATVVEGSGAPPYGADVLIRGGRIVEVAERIPPPEDAEIVDVAGREIVPGFVDVHSHDDLAVLDTRCEPKVRQGVTTVVVGNCGHGAAPTGPPGLAELFAPVLGGTRPDLRHACVRDYLADLAAAPRTVNAGVLVGHAALRTDVVGLASRAASARELDRICGRLDEALDAGATGLSLGLLYAPGNRASTDELEAVASVVAARGAVLAAHVRDEGDGVVDAVDEVAALGRSTGCAVHVSHLKVVGTRNVGRMPEVLARLDHHRASGVDVTADVYPYHAGSTTTSTLLPDWALVDGLTSINAALRDPRSRQRLKAHLRDGGSVPGPTDLLLAGFHAPDNRPYEGSSLAAIARDRAQEPVDCLLELLTDEGGALTAILFHTDPAGVREALSWPHTMIGSDGLPHAHGYVHPRLYGTFVRVLTEYAGEGGPLTHAEAIHRMTGLSARRFGIADRGTVAAGQIADLVVLDPARLEDRATFTSPRRHPGGIERVLVAGTTVWREGDTDVLRRGTFVPYAGA